MIYLTQLLFVVPGREQTFLQFEEVALAVMKKYGGSLLQRIRPPREAFIEGEGEPPYEIHVVTFPTQDALDAFLRDEDRRAILHLKEQSIRSALVLQGTPWG